MNATYIKSKMMPKRCQPGFTLVELMVTLIIFSIIVAAIFGVLINSQKSKEKTQLLVDATQQSRIAIDILTSDLRTAGYGIDRDVQGMFVYAGPYEVAFNANIEPYPDGNTPQIPTSMSPSGSPATIPFMGGTAYTPPVTASGAETIVYSINSNGDGAFNASDLTDNTEESYTRNPGDCLLIRRVYGSIGGGSNGGTAQAIALIKGPNVYPNQTVFSRPIFQYYYDHDNNPTTADSLWGDTDGDLEMDSSEVLTLTPVANPALIRRVVATIVSPTASPIRGSYPEITLVTEVSTFRNEPVTRYSFTAHVYNSTDGDSLFDTGESRLDSFLISLNTGQSAKTGAGSAPQGKVVFSVSPGPITATVTPLAGWKLTSPRTSFTVSMGNANVDSSVTCRHFGFKWVGTGYLKGKVLYDSLANGAIDGSERGIAGVRLSIPALGQSFVTDASGNFQTQVTSRETMVVYQYDSIGYFSVNNALCQAVPTDSAGFPAVSFNSVSFWVGNNDTARVTFFDKKAVGSPCTLRVVSPNGGEYWTAGSSQTISWYANGIDDNITAVDLYYSIDNGVTWQPKIATVTHGTSSSWSGSYTWTPPSLPSTQCLVRAFAYDVGGNMDEDTSNAVFTIAPRNISSTRFYYRKIQSDAKFGGSATRYIRSLMDTTTSIDSTTMITSTVNGTSSIIMKLSSSDSASYITPKGILGAGIIPAGNWTFYIMGKVGESNSNNASYYYFKMYKTDSLGLNRSLLFTTTQTSPMLTTTNTQYTVTHAYTLPCTLNANNRLLSEIWVYRSTTGSKTATPRYTFGGSTTTYFNTP